MTHAHTAYKSAVWVLIGFGAGWLLGALCSASGSPWLLAAIRGVEPVGTLFVNAIRMAVVPLVVASLIGGIVSITNTRSLTRMGARSLIVFVALTFSAAICAMVIAAPVFARLEVDQAVVQSLRESASAVDPAVAAAMPTFGHWLSELVPSNPIKAAADGAMLPLIVFTLGFAIALTRVSGERRAIVVGFFSGLADAMLIIVECVIALAPIGVFALIAPLASRVGAPAAGALLFYVLVAASLTIAVLALVVYPATSFAAGISLRRFTRACAPAQALALSSRSTMASLPAMISAASALGVPQQVTSFVVPLAASTLRVGSAVGQTVAVIFAARLFDVTLSPFQLVTILVTTVLTTFTVPGIPGGSIIVMVPILMVANVPTEAVGVLLGADLIPDMFRTMANVTGGIAAAAIVCRSAPQEESEPLLVAVPAQRS